MTIHRGNAEHYRWGEHGEGWHLVNRPELSVIQERLAPGGAEVCHAHARARQFFFILAGQATFERAGQSFTLGPQEGIEVAPGTTHRIENRGSAPLEFLVISHPHSHGDRSPCPPVMA